MKSPLLHFVGTTVVLAAGGAVAGAVCGLLTLVPPWFDPQFQSAVAQPWVIGLVALMGAMVGAALGPVVGWLLLGRVPLWRALVEPVAGSVVGMLLASYNPWLPGTDGVVIGGILGALVATLRLRVVKKPLPTRGI